MTEELEFSDKWPQIDRILSQLNRLSELTDEELEARVKELDLKKGRD